MSSESQYVVSSKSSDGSGIFLSSGWISEPKMWGYSEQTLMARPFWPLSRQWEHKKTFSSPFVLRHQFRRNERDWMRCNEMSDLWVVLLNKMVRVVGLCRKEGGSEPLQSMWSYPQLKRMENFNVIISSAEINED